MKNRNITLFATPLILTGLLAAAPIATADSATFNQPPADAPAIGETLAADLEAYEQSHHKIQARKSLSNDAAPADTSTTVNVQKLRADLASYYRRDALNDIDDSATQSRPLFVQNLARDIAQFERTNGDLSGL